MDKRQQKKFEKLLAQMAKVNQTDVETIKEVNNLDALQSFEEKVLESQSVLNFYRARIEPRLEKGEQPAEFDKRYREWRIRKCEECEEEFAYAYSYEGVKFCSLDCLDGALRKIGLQVTRGRELKKRWGVFAHPAIVPSSALATLKTLYSDASPDAFSPEVPDHPTPHQVQDAESQMQDTPA